MQKQWVMPAILVAFTVATVAGLCKFPPKNSESVAAWVQAFGSLAAIGIAWWIPTRDRIAAEERNRVENARRHYVAARAVQSAAMDMVLLGQNSLVLAPSRWEQGLDGADAVTFDSAINNLSTLEKTIDDIEQSKLVFNIRALLREIRTFVCQKDTPADISSTSGPLRKAAPLQLNHYSSLMKTLLDLANSGAEKAADDYKKISSSPRSNSSPR